MPLVSLILMHLEAFQSCFFPWPPLSLNPPQTHWLGSRKVWEHFQHANVAMSVRWVLLGDDMVQVCAMLG